MPTRILVIEDEPAIADTLIYALTTEGYEPVWCTTGQAALASLRQSAFALALLDVGLPDMNGFNLFREIHRQWALPVIFLTARPVKSTASWGWNSAPTTMFPSHSVPAKYVPAYVWYCGAHSAVRR